MFNHLLELVRSGENIILAQMSSSSEDNVSDTESRSGEEVFRSKVLGGRDVRRCTCHTPEESINRMRAVLEKMSENLPVVLAQQRGLASQQQSLQFSQQQVEGSVQHLNQRLTTMEDHISPRSVSIGPNQGGPLVAGNILSRLAPSHSSNYIDTQPETEIREVDSEEVALRRSKRLLEKRGKLCPSSPTRAFSRAAEIAGLSAPIVINVGESKISGASGLAAGRHFEEAELSQFDFHEGYRLGGEWPSVGEGSYQQREVEGNPLTYLPNTSQTGEAPRSPSIWRPKAYTTS